MEKLSQKLLKYISNLNNISEPDAAKLIQKCLLQISSKQNINYNELYELLYSYAGLSFCLAGSCDKSTLEKCKEMCHCVIFKNKCKPRYLPEALTINQDPDKWLKSIRTNELEEFLEFASYLYHNYDGGGLTDNSFDALEYTLNKRLMTKGKRWEKIGAEPIEKLRINLPYPMPSLDKIKPGMPSLINFLEKSNKYGMVWSDKLDGVSGMIVFKKGKVDKIYTRGNGQIGGDVSYLQNYIKLPIPTFNYFVVRGEFIISKKNWNEKYKGVYSNARSLVSATINSGYVTPSLIDIEFIAYQIIDWSEKEILPPSQSIKYLIEQGFNVVRNGLFQKGKDLLTFDVITKYKENRQSSDYDIDGLVLTLDVSQQTGILQNPEYSKAFKMTLEEQLRKTKIIAVDWNITRYGRYFPVAVYEAVYIDGVRIHRASAHNAKHVSDWHLGRGTEIVVTRSGDVIPVIKDVKVNIDINPILPSTEYSWHWSDSGKDIVLDNIEENPEVQIKRIVHFFGTIKTPQFGEGRIRKLYENGYKTIKSLTSAKQEDFKKIKGFGDKLSKTVYDSIHNTMKNTRIDRYYIAITTFKTMIARTTFKQVLRYYPDILTATKQDIYNYFKDAKNKIPGIGVKRVDYLAESIPQFRELLLSLNKDDIQYAIDYDKKRLEDIKRIGYNLSIKGKTFVMTGFLLSPNYELEDYIWDNWGNISSTVTGGEDGTFAVISANLANITGKMLKANEFGIPVYSVEEFIKKFNIPIKIDENDKIDFEKISIEENT
jgi:DNA ligase (NAD+)